jgi:hypothetical protein
MAEKVSEVPIDSNSIEDLDIVINFVELPEVLTILDGAKAFADIPEDIQQVGEIPNDDQVQQRDPSIEFINLLDRASDLFNGGQFQQRNLSPIDFANVINQVSNEQHAQIGDDINDPRIVQLNNMIAHMRATNDKSGNRPIESIGDGMRRIIDCGKALLELKQSEMIHDGLNAL